MEQPQIQSTQVCSAQVHSVFTSEGDWLGDFPNEEFAELFARTVAQFAQSCKVVSPLGECLGQYDADRVGA